MAARRASAAHGSALRQNTEPRPRGEPTGAPRRSTPPGVSDIGRLHPRGSEGAFAGRYPGRYHRHHPRAISVPLARPPLFRLPISRHSEGGIRRRRHLLEHVNAAMELAHPAGAESLAAQPSQLPSAVASTKKSLLPILRNLDARAQPSPNTIPVARKIKKMLKTMRYRRQLLAGRMAG